MPFPQVKRVIYDKNPLVEVIFQAKFPRFLQIDGEPPADFQRRLLADYPIYEQRNVLQIVFAPAQQGRPPASELTGRMHTFLSKDRIWAATLAGDYLSLATKQYVRWEDFRLRVEVILKLALEIYPLQLFTRLGLLQQPTKDGKLAKLPLYGQIAEFSSLTVSLATLVRDDTGLNT